MALQFSTDIRNAMLNAIESTTGTSAILKLWSGTKPANCAAADAGDGDVLAQWSLASDWMDAAASGQKAFSDLPLEEDAALADGQATHFRLYDSGGSTCVMQGTVTEAGGGGDAIINNDAVETGQPVSITVATLTAPGA